MKFFKTLAIVLAVAFVAACSKPLSTVELLDRATNAMSAEKRDFRAAEVDIKTVLQQEPDNARARFLYGLFYLQTMDPSAAISEFERSLDAERQDEAVKALARATLEAGRADDFLQAWDRGDFVSVQDTYVLAAMRARALARAQDFEGSREWLATAEQRFAQGEAAGSPGTVEDHAYFDMTRAMFSGLLDKNLETAQEIVEELLARSPEYAEAWSLRGLLASTNDLMEQAAESYKKAYSLNPYRLNDRINYVNASVRSGDNDGAKEELRSLQRLIPNSPKVNYLQGRLAFSEGDYKTAIDTLSRVLTYAPNNADALLLSGSANARENNLATAARQLTQFLTQQPGHVEARLQLAQVRIKMDDAKKAENLIRQVLEEDEMNVSALGLLAVALAAQGMPVESATAYEQLATIDPQSSGAQLAAGAQNLAAGNTQEARKYLREAIRLTPESEDAWPRLVAALAQAGEYDEAREVVGEYLEQHPDSPVPHVLAGRLALASNDLDAARDYFDRALELDPSSSLANDGLATLAFLDRDYDGAREALERSLAANPGDLPSALGLAALAERTGNTQGMLDTLQDSIAANPTALEPRLALARYAANEGDFLEAIELLGEVRSEHNDSFMLHEILAGAYISVDQVSAALESAGKLVELRPEDPGALALSARVQLRAGRPEAAETQARAALGLAPEDVSLRQLLIQALVAQNERGAVKTEIAKLPEDVQNTPQMLTLRGRLAMADQEFDKAIAVLEPAFEQQRSTLNLMLLTSSRWQADQRDEALNGLKSWLEEYPQDAVARNALASRSLEIGDDQMAKEQYAALLSEYPDSIVALNNLAWLLREEDSKQALDLIARAEKIAPDSAQIADTAAMVYLALGDNKKALVQSERALRGAPDDAVVRYHRAQVLVQAGKGADAAPLLETLIAAPGFADKDAAKALLDTLSR